MDETLKSPPFIPINGEGYDNSSLAQRVAEQLRNLIMEGTLAPDSQLPNEPDLSIFLKVKSQHGQVWSYNLRASWVHSAPLGGWNVYREESSHL